MSSRVISLIVCLILVAVGTSAIAQGDEWWSSPPKESALITTTAVESGNSYVNWEKGEIVVEGIGIARAERGLSQADLKYRALRAAKVVAQRNFLEATGQVYLTSGTLVEMGALENDEIKSAVEGYVKGLKEAREPLIEHQDDGSIIAHVWLGRDFSGLTSNLYKPINEFEKKKREKEPVVEYPRKQVSASADSYTGLIVDCRKKKARPSITPKIIDEQEREIYGSLNVSRLWLLNHGLVGYAGDVAAAKERQKERLGDNPLVVTPMMITGANRDIAVMDDATSKKIVSADKETNFLNQCKVVFLVD